MRIPQIMSARTASGLLAAVVAAGLVGAPTAVLARGEAWVVTEPVFGGCAGGGSLFEVFFVYPDGEVFFQNTLVYVDADVYMDEVFTAVFPDTEEDTWGLFDVNHRGLQTQSFPLPAATPYRMTNEIANSDGEMLWESTIIVDDCNAPDITLNRHGPASQRLANQGFEKAGSTGKRAKKWSSNSAGLAKRICGESDDVFNGECAMRWKPSASETSSLKQSATAEMAEVDDVIRLSAWVSAEALVGGGTLKATVRFADGSKGKIAIDIPEGDYDYTRLADDIVVSDKVTRVDVSVSSKQGSGAFFVDDLMLTAIANGVPLP